MQLSFFFHFLWQSYVRRLHKLFYTAVSHSHGRQASTTTTVVKRRTSCSCFWPGKYRRCLNCWTKPDGASNDTAFKSTAYQRHRHSFFNFRKCNWLSYVGIWMWRDGFLATITKFSLCVISKLHSNMIIEISKHFWMSSKQIANFQFTTPSITDIPTLYFKRLNSVSVTAWHTVNIVSTHASENKKIRTRI